MVTVKIMFYKGKGNVVDKLIRLWTHSKYSHSELEITTNGKSVTYGAFPFEGVKYVENKVYKKDSWDGFEIAIEDVPKMIEFLNKQVGKKYDLKAIFLTFIFPFKSQDPDKWFCSELCAKVVKLCVSGTDKLLKRTASNSPEKLVKRLLRNGLIKYVE